MTYLLDTNVVSEMRKIRVGRADQHLAAWAESVSPASLCISAIALQKLEISVLLVERRDPEGGVHLRGWLEERVIPVFSGRTLPVDSSVAIHSAKSHVPDPRPLRDSLIGATADLHGLTPVTRNTKDFDYLQSRLLNPWEAI